MTAIINLLVAVIVSVFSGNPSEEIQDKNHVTIKPEEIVNKECNEVLEICFNWNETV